MRNYGTYIPILAINKFVYNTPTRKLTLNSNCAPVCTQYLNLTSYISQLSFKTYNIFMTKIHKKGAKKP